jgi:hypothetical protein
MRDGGTNEWKRFSGGFISPIVLILQFTVRFVISFLSLIHLTLLGRWCESLYEAVSDALPCRASPNPECSAPPDRHSQPDQCQVISLVVDLFYNVLPTRGSFGRLRTARESML